MDSASGDPDRALYLWSDAPRFEVSTAPLADQAGQAVQLPEMVQFDYALHLSDQQVGFIFSPPCPFTSVFPTSDRSGQATGCVCSQSCCCEHNLC